MPEFMFKRIWVFLIKKQAETDPFLDYILVAHIFTSFITLQEDFLITVYMYVL